MKSQDYISDCHALLRRLQESEQKQQKGTQKEFQRRFQQLLLVKEEPLPAPYYICIMLQLQEAVYFMLLCAVIFEIDPSFRSYCIQKGGVPYLCIGVVFSLFQKIRPIELTHILAAMDDETMPLLFEETASDYVLHRQLKARETVLYYCLSDQMKPLRGVRIWQDAFHGASIYASEYEILQAYVVQRRRIGLLGQKGSGRTWLMHRLCDELNLVCFFIHIEAQQKLDDLLLYMLLQNCLVVLQGEEELWQSWFQTLEDYQIPVILFCDHASHDLPVLQLEPLSKEDDCLLKSYYDIEEDEVSSFRMLPIDYTGSHKMISCTSHSPFVQVSKREETFDDLFLRDEMKDALEHILYMMSHPYLRSRCLSLLFYGTSGTGKTLCAHVLAKEAGLPLWNVNLSMILDKYIGESEKHLEQLFYQAQKENCILLFDEADVLFSKRTQINSSNDRYANSSTAYLLQKLESYQGILILTTNYLHHFDDAFLRRIQFVLHFPEPSKHQLYQKWYHCFQDFSCLGKEDYEKLIELKEISMASIENVKWNAVIYWKQSKQKEMGKIHIQKALLQEYEKIQKRMPSIWNDINAS